MAPEQGTPEWDLFLAAIDVAAWPPLRIRTFSTTVPRVRIERLRECLEACGIDWRKVKEAWNG